MNAGSILLFSVGGIMVMACLLLHYVDISIPTPHLDPLFEIGIPLTFACCGISMIIVGSIWVYQEGRTKPTDVHSQERLTK